MSDTDPGDRTVLVDHDDVRSWADAHDAVPVRPDGAGVPVGFATGSDGDEPNRIEWETFFDAFENGRLAVLVDGADAEFVSRDRVAGGDDESASEAVREETRAASREKDRVGDPAATRREVEAEDQENVDNHRDEEPFQS